MRVKNIVIAAITLIAALSARGQNPEKIQSDSLKRMHPRARTTMMKISVPTIFLPLQFSNSLVQVSYCSV